MDSVFVFFWVGFLALMVAIGLKWGVIVGLVVFGIIMIVFSFLAHFVDTYDV